MAHGTWNMEHGIWDMAHGIWQTNARTLSLAGRSKGGDKPGHRGLVDVGGESALAMGKGAVWYDFRTLRRNDERGVHVQTMMQIMYMIGELALWSIATELLSFGTSLVPVSVIIMRWPMLSKCSICRTYTGNPGWT